MAVFLSSGEWCDYIRIPSYAAVILWGGSALRCTACRFGDCNQNRAEQNDNFKCFRYRKYKRDPTWNSQMCPKNSVVLVFKWWLWWNCENSTQTRDANLYRIVCFTISWNQDIGLDLCNNYLLLVWNLLYCLGKTYYLASENKVVKNIRTYGESCDRLRF